MRWNDKPQIVVTPVAHDGTMMGNKCRVRIVARGWGRLSICNNYNKFSSYFVGEKEWILTLPKSPVLRISASNIFGTMTQIIPNISQKFFGEDEFFSQLRLTPKLPLVDISPIRQIRLPQTIRAKPLSEKINGKRIRVAGATIKYTGLHVVTEIKNRYPVIKNNYQLKIIPELVDFRLKAKPLNINHVFKTIDSEGVTR